MSDTAWIGLAALALVAVVATAVFLFRKKDSFSATARIKGVGEARIGSSTNARDAAIRDGVATEDVTATAPQGTAIVERVSGRNLTATAGEPMAPKSIPPGH